MLCKNPHESGRKTGKDNKMEIYTGIVRTAMFMGIMVIFLNMLTRG